MKNASLTLLLTALAAVAPFGSPTADARTTAPPPVQDGDFMTLFRQAMAINAKDEMKDLVRSRMQDAVREVNRICEAIAFNNNAQLEAEIDALRNAWRDAIDTDFVAEQYSYFSLLRGPAKDARRKLMVRYQNTVEEMNRALEKRELAALTGVGAEFGGLGRAFEDIGDRFQASQAWVNYAYCFEEATRGRDAQPLRACEGWGNALRLRSSIGLLDEYYRKARELKADLVAKGICPPDGEGGGEAGGDADEPGAEAPARAAPTPAGDEIAPLDATTAFEVLPDIEAIRRPSYTADSTYQIWQGVGLAATGSSLAVNSFKEGPKIVRVAEAKAVVDLDGSGGESEGDVEVPLTGNITPVQVQVGEGEERRPWAFLATVGQSRDTYQGFQFNMAPDNDQMSILVAPAGAVVASVAGTTLKVIDENMDGVYGSAPLEWQYVGLAPGEVQKDVDSVIVGEEKRARPWSRLQQLNGAWYEVQAHDSGNRITAEPATVETGTLRLDMKGVNADWLLVRGTGDLEDCFFDLLANRAGVEVPTGTYELYTGQVSKGKRDQLAKALVCPSSDTPTWRVDPGQTAVVELGAPFGFDFAFTQDDERVTVDGGSIVVTGRGRETYQRLWNCVVHPELESRRAGSSRGGKEGKLRSAESQEDITDNQNDFSLAWRPFDYEFEKKKPGETIELQMIEKKNKLFGKIESDWLAE